MWDVGSLRCETVWLLADYNYRPRAGRRQKRSERLNKDELDDEIVRLNVGGTRVMALRSTLLARGANFFRCLSCEQGK